MENVTVSSIAVDATQGGLDIYSNSLPPVNKNDILTFKFLDELTGNYFRCGSDHNSAGINYYNMKRVLYSSYFNFIISGGIPDNEKPNQDRGCGNDGYAVNKI